MENDRIDLSPLDPSIDKQKWNRLIESIVSRSIALRRNRLSLGYYIFVWSRPAFALAFALAFVAAIGASLRVERSVTGYNAKTAPAVRFAVWGITNERPTTTEILELLGGQNEDR